MILAFHTLAKMLRVKDKTKMNESKVKDKIKTAPKCSKGQDRVLKGPIDQQKRRSNHQLTC